MVKSNNVIDLGSRRAQMSTQVARGGDVGSQRPKRTDRFVPVENRAVVDMTERRNAMLVDERRQVKRTILTEFVGAFIVLPQRGLLRVSLYDISDNGLAFDLDSEQGLLRTGEEVAMRVYLNQWTYFPFSVTISNARAVDEEGVGRHGASFLKGDVNHDALHHFVKFIETVSASLATDHGDVMVSNLK